MKKSLTFKLTLYFSAALVLFILLISALVGHLLLVRSEKFYIDRLTALADSLAENIEENGGINLNFPPMEKPPKPPPKFYTRRDFSASGDNPEQKKRMKEAEIGRKLRDLNRISQGEVWIVDQKNHTIIAYGKENSVKTDELPPNAEKMLASVLSGERATSRNFSELLSSPSITVGAPIFDKDKNVQGALLLHSKLSGLRAAQREAFSLFIAALALALAISLAFSAILARSFIKPLKRMEEFAGELAKEKYYLRSNITREDEVGSLAKSLDLLAEKLSEIQKEKSRLEKMRQDFLTGVSHELKTPLTSLRGSLEMMTAGLVKTEEDRANYLKQMEKNVVGLGRLVQDLFELSRLQNADFKIEKSELNYFDPLKDAVDAAKQLGASKKISVRYSESVEPFVMKGDYGRLRQMFLAVLDNAVKFSPVGGEITVAATIQGDSVSISVTDQGEGIEKEDLEHIFEKFHSQKHKNGDGTGLGLAIAKEIALRHGITISCESEKGKGAKFVFDNVIH